VLHYSDEIGKMRLMPIDNGPSWSFKTLCLQPIVDVRQTIGASAVDKVKKNFSLYSVSRLFQ